MQSRRTESSRVAVVLWLAGELDGSGRQCHNDESCSRRTPRPSWLSKPASPASGSASVRKHPTSMSSLRALHRATPSPLRSCSNCLRRYSLASPSSQQQTQKKVIFSGIQPTGIPHLGNYLGALRQWVRLQDEASPDTTLLFSIVDLHAITIKQDARELANWRKEMLASLLAVGLDPKRCIIFTQSSVKQHAELMWILSCGASMGYLGRMTQWKVSVQLTQKKNYSKLYYTQTQLRNTKLTHLTTGQTLPPIRLLPPRPLQQQRRPKTRPLLLPRPPSRRHPPVQHHARPRRRRPSPAPGIHARASHRLQPCLLFLAIFFIISSSRRRRRRSSPPNNPPNPAQPRQTHHEPYGPHQENEQKRR